MEIVGTPECLLPSYNLKWMKYINRRTKLEGTIMSAFIQMNYATLQIVLADACTRTLREQIRDYTPS